MRWRRWAMGADASSWLGRVLAWACLLGVVAAFWPLIARLARHANAVLAFPWQIDYDEGMVLHAAWIVGQPGNPYQWPTPDRFVSATYMPLYYLINAPWLAAAGPNLEGGRFVSLVATGLAGLAIGWWVWQERRSLAAALLALAVWLSLGPVFVWGTLYKPDMLALAFTVVGLALARRWPRWPGLVAAVIVFGLAFFTKQTALVGPLAVGLWFLTRGGPWRGFAAAMAAALLVLYAVGLALSGGGLWLHTVLFQQTIPWSVGQLRHNLDKVVETYPWLLLAAVVGLALTWRRGEAVPEPVGVGTLARRWTALRRLAPNLPGLYLLTVVPAIALANGRVGVNYGLLLDLFPPLCVVCAIAAADGLEQALVPRAWTPRRLVALLAGLVVVGLLAAQARADNDVSEWYTAHRMPSRERAGRMLGIARLVEQAKGPLLSEDIWLLLRAGQPVRYDDTFMMAQIDRSSLWDDRQLIDDLEMRRFEFVLLEYDITTVERSPRWSATALKALRANYEILYRDVVSVHRPRSLLRGVGQRQGVDFGGQLTLVETALSATEVRPGGVVWLLQRWKRAGVIAGDQRVYVEFVRSDGGLAARVDLPPGREPTSAWDETEFAESELPVRLPETLVPGQYALRLVVAPGPEAPVLPASRDGQPLANGASLGAIVVLADSPL